MDERDNLYEQIVAEYIKTGSVKQVVKNLGTNTIKVRRVLITEGLWESETSRNVGALYYEGKSVKEIAEILCMSEKNVQSYMPYTRGAYGGTKSSDAERSVEYRNRKTNAADKQAMVTEGSTEEGFEPTMGKEIPKSNIIDFEKVRKSKADKESETTGLIKMPAVLKLRLELIEPFYGDMEDEGLGMEGEEKAAFLKNAKAKEGIIRDVLVSAEMNLHCMHYMIQKLFGWQNSHLHNYYLANKDFDMVTDGQKVEEYLNLCGTLFRFPGSELDDQFWDDDYDESVSIKTWLKSKYTYGFVDLAVENSYPRNRENVKEFRERFKKKLKTKKDMTLNQLNDIIMFESGYNVLIESLLLRHLFVKSYSSYQNLPPELWRSFQKMMVDNKKEAYDAFEKEDPEAYEAMVDMLDELVELRKSVISFERGMHMGHAAEIKKKFKKTPEEIIAEMEQQIHMLEAILIKDIADGNPMPIPFADSIYYNYDFGDDWTVRITCVDAYASDQDFDWTSPGMVNQETGERKMPTTPIKYTDSDGNEVSKEEAERLSEVYLKAKPICVYADGLNVMDDVGGLWGYKDFLERIHNSDDPEEAAESKDWARWMGWTGRKTKAENIL